MAKIVYAVAGEGNGHGVRSKVVISHLMKKHDVRVYSHGKGFDYLSKFFDVKRILGFHIYYRDNKVSSLLTGLVNALKFPFMILFNLRMLFDMIVFNPSVVITDFEPFSTYYGKLLFKKVISIDNQHMITNAQVDSRGAGVSGLGWIYYWYSWLVVKSFIFMPNVKLVTTFFYPNLKKKNVVFVDPILQDSVLSMKSSGSKHILVYQTSRSYLKMFDTLKKFDKKFIIYGFGIDKVDGNLIFKDFSKDGFYEDLQNAEAVVMNGSFTLIGEALFLKKPVFSIPIDRQFEQMLNACYLDKMGYGMNVRRINFSNFSKFLSSLEKYKNELKKYKHDHNRKLFNELERLISK